MLRKTLSGFLAFAMLLSLCFQLTASAETFVKEWEFDGTVSGFGGNNSTLSSVNGKLVQTVTTAKNNTWLLSPNNLSVNSSVYKYIKMRVKNDTTAAGSLAFEATGTEKSTFSGSFTILGTVPNDGEFHDYIIDLSEYSDWAGTISRFRLRLTAWNCEGTVEIDYIKLSDTEADQNPLPDENDEGQFRWNFDSGTEGFLANNSSVTSVDGKLVQTVTTAKSNTWLLSPNNLGIDSSVYNCLKIRVKNSTTAAGNLSIEAIGADKIAFEGAWISIGDGVVPNDGEFHEYVIDLSKCADWTGEISRFHLRLSAWTSEGTIEIDYIDISDSGNTGGGAEEASINIASVSNPADVAFGTVVPLSVSVGNGAPTNVEYFVNDVSIGNANESPFTVDWTPPAVGGYYIKAVAAVGEKTVSSPEVYVNVYDGSIVEKSAYYWRFDESTEGFAGNASSLSCNDGCLVQTVEAGKQNSFLVSRTALGIDASIYKYLKIRVAAQYSSAKGTFSVQWITDDDMTYESSWSSGDKTNLVGAAKITNDGRFYDYVADFSNCSAWSGTIRQLRIKVTPWVDANTDMIANIDYIRISDTAQNGIDESDVPKKYAIDKPKYSNGKILTGSLLNNNGDGKEDTEDITYVIAKFESDNIFAGALIKQVTLNEGEKDTTVIDVTGMNIADDERVDVLTVNSLDELVPLTDKFTVYDKGISANSASFAGAFMDHMVLQRDMPVNVWGKADAADGAILEVSFAGNTVEAVVENGKWKTKLPALEESFEPQVLTLKSIDNIQEITDVLVGDVYLVGGQSNASLALTSTDTWETDCVNAVEEDNIRILFSHKKNSVDGWSETKRDDPFEDDVWQVAKYIPKEEVGASKYGFTVAGCPALGYYFADALREDGIDVPIGLVMTPKSGATLSALMPPEFSEGITDTRKAQGYNAFIAPVENVTAKGMLWYQGESDTNDTLSAIYTERFSTFIDYMRDKSGNSTMPVFMVQLCSHTDQTTGTTANWKLPRFRAIQTDMILNRSIDGLYMVTSLDKGWKKADSDMAHPKYKKPIGQRLARAAENVLYGRQNTLEPMPVSVKYEIGRCIITFDTELTERSDVKGFEVIHNGVAYAATAAASGNTVVVEDENGALLASAADGVRYAFYSAASPLVANLQGANGLYAPTFALDNANSGSSVNARDIAPLSQGQAE